MLDAEDACNALNLLEPTQHKHENLEGLLYRDGEGSLIAQ